MEMGFVKNLVGRAQGKEYPWNVLQRLQHLKLTRRKTTKKPVLMIENSIGLFYLPNNLAESSSEGLVHRKIPIFLDADKLHPQACLQQHFSGESHEWSHNHSRNLSTHN